MELVVVLAIVGTLVALALPAVTKVRATSRKVTCINHLHNIAVAMTGFDAAHNRLPAAGNYGHTPDLKSRPHHSWAVSLLPYVEQNTLSQQIDVNRSIKDPENEILKTSHVPVYVCPADISRSDEKLADLSYAVNAGVGFTVKYHNGVRDCPVNTKWTLLDLDGDGAACTGNEEEDDHDRRLFKHMGLFFLETWNTEITRRHYALADVKDGLSQTYMVTDNARTGMDKEATGFGFADPSPYHTCFFIGDPCGGTSCAPGTVDYGRSNAGAFQINSGLWSPEGSSPVPNSFHDGGVNMAYADGHVGFLSESIDGGVHAALASPVGILLEGTALAQSLASGY